MKTRLAALVSCLAVLAVDASDVSGRRMVWAHYVPWHTPDNYSLTPLTHYNFPSDDVSDAPYEDEIRRALSMGIDGFFFDVVAHKGYTSYSNLSPFLKAAEGTKFMCAVCLDVKTDVTNQIAELKKMLDLNAGHPNYARYCGKPVVMTYTFLSWSPDEWREIREGLFRAGWDIWLVANLGRGYRPYDESLIERYAEVFDGAYFFVYNIVREPSVRGMNERTAALFAQRGKLYMPCLNPGYYGAWRNGRNDFYQPYRCLDTLQDAFEAAMTVSPQWVHLTTWNDHDETSMCPRRLTPGFVPLVRAYSDSLKGKTPPKRMDVVFAYHREEFAGTLARFEAMRLPSLDCGSMKISMRLLDASGAVVFESPDKTFSGGPWERMEWLVPTADLAVNPVLVPQVAVRDNEGVRRAELPPIFLVRGWLEDAETVRVALSDCAAGDASLKIDYHDGRITASLSFSADTEVKRATLFRNGCPLAQFAPGDMEDDAQIALSMSGAGFWGIVPDGGRIVSAWRQSTKNDQKGDFRWDATRVVSCGTPSWSKSGVLVAGGGSLALVLSGGKDKRRIPVVDLVKSRAVTVGGMTYSIVPDLTLHTRRPWSAKSGKAKLSVFDRPPHETDSFWVRVECTDGRLFASRPVWPFAKGVAVRETELVETPVTMEKTSGACGTPGEREFIASPGDIPIRATCIVKRKASPLSIRRSQWNFEGSGVNEFGDRCITKIPTSAYVDREGGGKSLRFDGKGTVNPRLPLRMWPSGPATIAFDVNPEPFNGRRQGILVREGWMDGLSVWLTGDGCVEVERSALNPEERFVLKGATPLVPSRWTHVMVDYDGAKLRISLNGRLDVEGNCPIVRRYGNCTVSIGGGSAEAFKGQFDSLYISGEKETGVNVGCGTPSFKTMAYFSEARRLYHTPDYAAGTNSVIHRYSREDPFGFDGKYDLPEIERRGIPDAPIFWNVPGLRNVRDIGGWTGLNTGLVYRGSQLYRVADAPDGINMETRRIIHEEWKLATDFDLRGVKEWGIKEYANTNLSEMTEIGVRKISHGFPSYETLFKYPKIVSAALKDLAKPGTYPTYIHCAGGADRTGSLVFILEALCGVPEADIDIDYELTSFATIFGIRDRNVTGEKIAFKRFKDKFRSYPGTTLKEQVENACLTTFGMTREEVATIRRILMKTCIARDGGAAK